MADDLPTLGILIAVMKCAKSTIFEFSIAVTNLLVDFSPNPSSCFISFIWLYSSYTSEYVFNQPLFINVFSVASDKPSMFIPCFDTKVSNLPSSLPLQSGLVQCKTSESLSFTMTVGAEHTGHLFGIV